MDIKSLEELQQPDDRVTHTWTPSPEHGAQAEAAAEYHQKMIAHLDLVQNVPDAVRDNFERLRTIYSYGVLCYDFYTVAHDQARLVLGQALGARFIEDFNGTVIVVDKNGVELPPVKVQTYAELSEQVRTGHWARKGWRLRLRRTGQYIRFDGMTDSLLTWARTEGLLHGEGNRHRERLLKDLRDNAAHPTGYHLLTPAHAAQALADLAELINHLWGADTPGGRMYPAPVHRDIIAVGWDTTTMHMIWFSADHPAPTLPDLSTEDFVYVLVRAHADDQVAQFDAQYESTRYPCEWLFGPCSWQDAAAWLAREQPAADQVDILDRHFLLRYQQPRLYLPRHPNVAAALDGTERDGTWFLVRADSPLPPFNHLREWLSATGTCTGAGPCTTCAVNVIDTGPLDDMLRHLADIGAAANPRPMPDIRVPSHTPRWNEIIPHGGWTVPPQ